MVTAQCHTVDTAYISWVLRAGFAPGLIIYRPACLQKMFCEDTLRNSSLRGLLIGSELSFINGTDYMQV